MMDVLTDSTPAFVGKRSIYTQLLIQAMRDVPDGETFTYTQAMTVTGLSATKTKTYLLSANRSLLRDYGIVYNCCRNVGYTRLTPEEVPTVANTKSLNKMRGTTERYRDTLEAVDPGTLSQEAHTKHTLGMLNVHLMEGVINRKSQRTIEKQIVQSKPELPDRDKMIAMYKGLFS